MTILDDAIREGRSLKGVGYRFCTQGARTPLPSEATLRSSGMCCTEFADHMRRAGGKKQVGGTPAWGRFLDGNGEFLEEFDARRWYCVGSVAFQYWRGPSHEGHIQWISRPNQLALDCSFAFGVAERLVSDYTYQGGWDVVGTMPDFPGAEGLPWRSPWGSISVGGYPGHCATPEATARWMARVAAVIYGLPAILPVMTSCVELTGGWSSGGCVTDVPGYLRAVDHDSLGWFQQRPAAGWGTPQQITNAEYALSKFCDAAIAAAPHWPTRDDYTAQELGKWAQNVQRSAFPDRYAKLGFPMAQKLLEGSLWEGHKLVGGSPVVVKPPPKDKDDEPVEEPVDEEPVDEQPEDDRPDRQERRERRLERREKRQDRRERREERRDDEGRLNENPKVREVEEQVGENVAEDSVTTQPLTLGQISERAEKRRLENQERLEQQLAEEADRKRRRRKIHPKVAASSSTALIVAGLLAVIEGQFNLSAPPGTEVYLAGLITALSGAVAGYLKSSD